MRKSEKSNAQGCAQANAPRPVVHTHRQPDDGRAQPRQGGMRAVGPAREVLPPAPVQCAMPCEVLAAHRAHEERMCELNMYEECAARERAERLAQERVAHGPPRPRKRAR